MPKDPIHDLRVRDDGDDLHLCDAGTEKRVDLEDFSQQARPGSAPGLGEVGVLGEVVVFVAWLLGVRVLAALRFA